MEYNTIISPQAVVDHLSDPEWVIIDCRFSLGEPDRGELEYRSAHIPGSYYAHLDRDLSSPVIPGVTGRHPLPMIPEVHVLARKWGVDANSQVVVYDDDNGSIAARLWWIFRWLGHDRVAVLDGGWVNWIQLQLPVTTEIPDDKNGSFTPDVRKWMSIDTEKINQIRKQREWKLVDARNEERYLGLVEPIDPVAGHIEGAVNHPFSLNITDSGFWKSPTELQTQMIKTGLAASPQKTVFYCGSGVTACHNVLAYKHAGLGDALLYPGSWSEWIALGGH
jgi:thiosulfate/3-mercaptopyruvate sulfurtransferase